MTDLAEAVHSDPELVRRFSACAKWSTDARYDPRPFTARHAAEARVKAARAIYEWTEERRRLREGEESGR